MSSQSAAERAAVVFEYSSAADPDVAPVPFVAFPASLHSGPGAGPGVVPLDLSARLFRPAPGARPPPARAAPCTSPNLLASYVRVRPGGARVLLDAPSTSFLFFVLRGEGEARRVGAAGGGDAAAGGDAALAWAAGDLFVLPAAAGVELSAVAGGAGGGPPPSDAAGAGAADAVLYAVCDSPLLGFLGVAPAAPRFDPTLWRAAALNAELARVRAHPAARTRNRTGILLGTAATSDDGAPVQTLTATHTLWALYNALPARTVQRPHRHNSVALDLCVAAGRDTYTLMAAEIDAKGELVPPVVRADWAPGAMFVTPPGLWHSHHNDGDEDGIVLPVQDAGLHTYMRTLMITFAPAPPA